MQDEISSLFHALIILYEDNCIFVVSTLLMLQGRFFAFKINWSRYDFNRISDVEIFSTFRFIDSWMAFWQRKINEKRLSIRMPTNRLKILKSFCNVFKKKNHKFSCYLIKSDILKMYALKEWAAYVERLLGDKIAIRNLLA